MFLKKINFRTKLINIIKINILLFVEIIKNILNLIICNISRNKGLNSINSLEEIVIKSNMNSYKSLHNLYELQNIEEIISIKIKKEKNLLIIDCNTEEHNWGWFVNAD